jgi:hypothetical protein
MPASVKVHAENVPEPPVNTTLIASDVLVNVVIVPSM